jgi:hypothetical protein
MSDSLWNELICRFPEYPRNLSVLSSDDRADYLALQAQFLADPGKTKNGERVESFTDRLEKIRHYVEFRIEDSWKRSLVCGVFFLQNGLALNIQRLRFLLGRCKSAINGSLQVLGYEVEPVSPNCGNQDFLMRIPSFIRTGHELKKWTIRRIPEPSGDYSLPAQAFVIPLPIPGMAPAAVDTQFVENSVQKKYPCPVKCRYKYYDLSYRSVSIQTEF